MDIKKARAILDLVDFKCDPKVTQALLRALVLCINPDHEFHGDVGYPMITVGRGHGSLADYIPEDDSFHIYIDGESYSHHP